MNQQRNRRGDGIGLEFTLTTIRGVALDGDVPGRLVAAAEIRIQSLRDDRSIVDALVRVRAELGGAAVATRVAMFPPGSTLHRFDVTGRSGPELNTLRHSIERHQAISSTVLIDDGPRRWLLALRWDEELVIRVEELVERAGFIDVTVDPSPVALARALPSGTTFARRDAALDEAFDVVIDGIPIAACSIETIGRQPPGLSISSTDVSTTVFDELVDPVAIVAEIERAFDQHSIQDEWALQLTGQSIGLPAERFADLTVQRRRRTRRFPSTTSGRRPASVLLSAPRSARRGSPAGSGRSTSPPRSSRPQACPSGHGPSSGCRRSRRRSPHGR